MIGIAVGTVLLPEMARRIAAGDEAGARHAQNRAIELTLLLSIPCLVAFLLLPELIMRALFMRGAFTAADAQAAAATLRPTRIGLLPFVLMRSATVTFLSRGDTMTPVKALAVAVAVNVALQDPADGLATRRSAWRFATSIGAWVNLVLLLGYAIRRDLVTVDARLRQSVAKLALAGFVLAVAVWLADRAVATLYADWTSLRDEAALATLAIIGAVIYGGAIFALFGRETLARLKRGARTATPSE